mgnify:CR=1 FL=1
MIESPEHHMQVIGKDIILNGRTITKEISEALDAFRSGKYEQFGEKLGDALSLSTVEEKKINTLETVDDRKRFVAEFGQGFLDATNVGSFNIDNLLMCIYEADQAALAIYASVDIIKSAIKDKDIMELLPGAIFLFAGLDYFKQALPICEAITTEFNW